MTIELTLTDTVPDDVTVVGVPVFAGLRGPNAVTGLNAPAADVDTGYLERRGFEAKVGETMVVPSTDGVTVVAVGLGPPEKVDAEALRKAAACVVRAAWKDARVATTILAAMPDGLGAGEAAQAVAEGARLAGYRFTRYKSDPKACRIESLAVVGTGDGARLGLERGARLAAAVAMARDLVNEPAGTLTPQRLADVAAEMAEREGLALTVLDENAIVAERLGGLLGVAAGSDQPPRLIELV
ncbi:MAG: M17 family peptidase N-terminal domain-containing protein, partial [Acidimicrobiales bacterium]